MKRLPLVILWLFFLGGFSSLYGEVARKPAKKADQKAVKKSAKKADQKAVEKGAVKENEKSDLEQRLEKVTPISETIKAVPPGLGRYLWNIVSFFGIFVLLGLAWIFSLHRKKIQPRLIVWGLVLQMTFAILILHTSPGRWIFDKAKTGVNYIIGFTNKGAGFVLGSFNDRKVMDQTIQGRVKVYVAHDGLVYIDGKPLKQGQYAKYLKTLRPAKKKKATPPSWKPTWEEDWKDPVKPKALVIPPEIAKKNIRDISYEYAYGYAQWLAKTKFPPQGFLFVFQILTTIIFFAALMGVLYHLGIMQWVVHGMAKVMAKTMGTSGAESLSVAANVFVGQTEAPLVVKPYVKDMTKSELMALMAGGFATIAGGVLVAYVAFGVSAGHLLAASVMSAPAALVMAKIMVPETEESVTAGKLDFAIEKETANVIDAAATGASDGMSLALNVAAMLLAFLALVAMIDALFGLVHSLHNSLIAALGIKNTISLFPKDLASFFGWVFYPVALAMGVPVQDCFKFAGLIGSKISINEFVAYYQLKLAMPKSLIDPQALSTRAVTLGTYALCGFANFGSIAIQLGGIGGIAPNKRKELAQLGLRAMFAGALASFMTATIAGVLLTPKECDWRYAMNLADSQITHHIDQDEAYPLAEFARPYYQYSKKYSGEDQESIGEEVREHLKTILAHYSQKDGSGQEEGYIFGRIFQKRYPMFRREVTKALDEMEEESKDDPGRLKFARELNLKF